MGGDQINLRSNNRTEKHEQSKWLTTVVNLKQYGNDKSIRRNFGLDWFK